MRQKKCSYRRCLTRIVGLVIVFVLIATHTFAQWTASGTHIYNSNAGNVGIGTTSPGAKLHLVGTGSLGLKLENTATSGGRYTSILMLDGNDNGWELDNGNHLTGSPLRFMPRVSGSSDGSNGFIINNSGNMAIGYAYNSGYSGKLNINGTVGIGTTSPDAILHVAEPGLGAGATDNIISYIYGATATSGGTFLDAGGRTRTRATMVIGNDYATNTGNVLNVYTGATDAALFVKGTGKVGVGTDNPLGLLHIDKSQNGETAMFLSNVNTGSNTEATLYISNGNTSATSAFLEATGTDATPSGGFVQDGAVLGSGSGLSGGLSIMTRASAPMRFYTSGHTNERMRIDENGNIGVGTTVPTSNLHILSSRATLKLEGTGDHSTLYLVSANNTGGGAPAIYFNRGNDNDYGALFVERGTGGGNVPMFSGTNANDFVLGSTSSVPLKFGVDKDVKMAIHPNGNVAIGVSDPGEYKLAVNGDVRARKIIVTQSGWPDYVFHSSYELKPLNEVALYIKENQRLPDVPSAKEVEENGISLGDNQAMLLKKIEELTLYMIEANKMNEALQKRVAQLEHSQKQ